jgi:guanosine-3',5'-bis(diphosphate) 3'-pyrophosphohydrolase
MAKTARYKMDQSKIYDVIALRIIVPTPSDCYQALGVIHGLYRPVPGRFKDYIAVPKPNGYRSLHTTIFSGDGTTLEIQIRTKKCTKKPNTVSLLTWPTKKLESNLSTEAEIKRKIGWTKELIEWQKDVEHHQEFMKNLRTTFSKSACSCLLQKAM